MRSSRFSPTRVAVPRPSRRQHESAYPTRARCAGYSRHVQRDCRWLSLALSLRDRQDFFGSSMKIGFDINSAGGAYGFFDGSFGVDFGSVNLTYDSSPADPGYQFSGQLRVGGNDFSVKFGSGGAQACYLFCDQNGCTEVLCLP